MSQRADAMFPLLLAGGRERCEICKSPLRREVLVDGGDGDGEEGRGVGGMCRRMAVKADEACVWVLSVEGCLLIFLFVLAVLGHVLFVVGIYDGADKRGEEGDVYSIERVALGVVNAVLTMSLLVLVQKVVSRWLRERDFFLAVASVDCGDLESGEGQRREWRRCGGVCQVVLGGILSAVAGAEIFFLLTVLPMGGGK